jgi:glycosyltransferase involved in cell wall biosynthesis
MKIGINLLFLTNNVSSGVGKHIESLLSGYRKIDLLKDCYLFVRETYYEKAKELYPEATVVLVQSPPLINFLLKHKKKRHSYYECRYLNQKTFANAVLNAKVDLILYPFNDSTLHFVDGLPNILVIHDLYYLRYPEYYGQLLYLYAKRKHEYFLKKASAIIAVSEFVKSEILTHIKASKDIFVQVIPNAVSTAKSFTNFVPVEGPYILSVGSQTKNKNILTLLKSYNLIKKRLPHQLVLLGKHREDTIEIQNYIKEHDLDDRVLCLEGVPDEHRNSLYRHASLLVTPSLCENFGRVPIEAALLGTPVITTKTSALPEVTLGLLTYYDPPTDSHALAMKMIDVLRNPPLPEVREQIACTYARTYDEASIASRFLYIFEGMITPQQNIVESKNP